jgi:RNA polymerase sigma factor (sigma-70 family)
MEYVAYDQSMTKVQEDWKNSKDEEVLRASLDNPELFRVLIERYENAFLRKANGVLHDWEDATDAVQDTFIRIYKYSDKFIKREGVEFKSWAYKILMNTSFTHYTKLKKRRGDVEYSDEIAANVPDQNDRFFDRLELTDSIDIVLAKMPDNLAEVLRAHYLDGRSYKDISNDLDITETALKMRLYRARQIFKKHFTAGAGF